MYLYAHTKHSTLTCTRHQSVFLLVRLLSFLVLEETFSPPTHRPRSGNLEEGSFEREGEGGGRERGRKGDREGERGREGEGKWRERGRRGGRQRERERE